LALPVGSVLRALILTKPKLVFRQTIFWPVNSAASSNFQPTILTVALCYSVAYVCLSSVTKCIVAKR